MSLRPALRAVRAPAASLRATRAFGSSAPRRGAHQSGSSEAETNETFLNTTWINTFVFLGLAYGAYTFLPSPTAAAASPTLAPEAVAAQAAESSKAPFLTRFLASRIDGAAELNTKRNDKHLELTVQAADQRLLFQEAEQPKVRRLTYPSAFEQASPFNIGVGSQVDLEDLKVKTDEQ